METTNTIQSHPEIKAGLQSTFEKVENFIANSPDEIFFQRKNDKWSIAENLDHLILSTKSLASGMKQSKIFFRAFGTAKNPSLSYDEMYDKYKTALDNGGLPGANPFLSKDIEATSKEVYLKNWKMIGEKFHERIELWSEKDLDKYRVPHPLLGKLTLREMLFFTIFHNEHHLKAMNVCLEK